MEAGGICCKFPGQYTPVVRKSPDAPLIEKDESKDPLARPEGLCLANCAWHVIVRQLCKLQHCQGKGSLLQHSGIQKDAIILGKELAMHLEAANAFV